MRTPPRAARVALVGPQGSVFLLRYDNEEVGVRWAMPGGGPARGESPARGALRELQGRRAGPGWRSAGCCAPLGYVANAAGTGG
ncbi:NUDIX domain-containing protein [Streptomyces zhihengii]|uniref:NUDIX domain-containing protein n=1 Tax=Streptomyces zhihengii TaxID=1818004 RepID=UPI001FD285FA|nr:NUDIX domain-containing protein [Streptomyces zhihengii]